MHHDLKLSVRYECPKLDGLKYWEFRSNTDRTFKVGDSVTFHIVTDVRQVVTGRTIGPVGITYVLEGGLLPDGYCIFSHTHWPEGGKP
jgi:hypothetical protein